MEKGTVLQILELVREIKANNRFYDLHVHPHEVMYDPLTYYPSAVGPGFYGTGSSAYNAPEITDVAIDGGFRREERRSNDILRAKMAVLTSRRIYAHTGPKVLGDLLELACIDEALLLPVMRSDEVDDGQIAQMRRMFGGDQRFHFGYCLSNSVPNDRIVEHLREVVADCPVRVLKIHPAVTGIDLGSAAGKERVEAMLEASRLTGLKVLIHGGLSPDCARRENSSYAAIANLLPIDWGITPETVIIAHAGCFGYPFDQVRAEVMPRMQGLLERFPHLMVDTSGANIDVLEQILIRVGRNRIVFGSDALYETPWFAMVKLWCALKAGVKDPEEGLLQIAGLNPARLLYGKSASIEGMNFFSEGRLTNQA